VGETQDQADPLLERQRQLWEEEARERLVSRISREQRGDQGKPDPRSGERKDNK
jgi:hypothetical protein